MSTVPDVIALKKSLSTEQRSSDIEPAAVGLRGIPETSAWQRELSLAIRNSTELLQQLGLAASGNLVNAAADEPLSVADDAGFPVMVTHSFLKRMRVGDPADPLLRQVLPVASEHRPVAGFVPDPVGDLSARRAPGLLQKYAGRALMIVSGACAIHCRYCFRRDYPYHEDAAAASGWEPALQALAEDDSITEVILSGGDPLMLSDARFSQLCRRLDEVPHIRRLRLHSRLPVVLPSRVTGELLSLLSSLRAQPLCVIHANHPAEIAGDCPAALQKLVRGGIPVLNQTVLLKGINDHADTLEELSRRLIDLGVLPYYLHQLDRVTGTAHFEVDLATGRRLITELSQRLPGYAVPRYVQEIAGEQQKTRL